MSWFKREEAPSIAGEIGKLDAAEAEKRKQEEAAASLQRLMKGYDQLPPEFQKKMLDLINPHENHHLDNI